MKLPFICLLFLGTLFCCGSSAAHAAIGTFSCTTSGGTPIFSTSVSYYDISIAAVAPTGVSGAGAGKVTFNPLIVYTPLSTFGSFSLNAIAGTSFGACTLVSRTQDSSIQYTFQFVSLTTVEAIAKTPRPGPDGFFDPNRDRDQSTAYTKLSLTYGAIQTTVNGGS